MPTALDAFIPFANQTLADSDWRSYFKTAAPDGVVPLVSSTLQVVQRGAGANMSVDVSAGLVMIQGDLGTNSTTKNLTIGANASGSTRLDLVVARLVFGTPTIQLDVVAGTPGSGVFPALTQSGTLWEVPLAGVTVANGAASILTASINNAQRYLNSGTGMNRLAAVTVASSTLPLYFGSQPNLQTVVVAGAGAAITSLPAAVAGSLLVLEFAGAGSITAGSNLKMPRSLTAASLTTITFESDGTNWVELSRANEPYTATFALLGPASGGAAAAPTPRVIATLDLPVTPTVQAYSASNNTVHTATPIVISFGGTLIDNLSQWSNVNPSRLTCQLTGYYFVWSNVIWQNTASAGDYVIRLYKNATTIVAENYLPNYPAHASTDLKMNVSAGISLTAGDYMVLLVSQTTGGDLNVLAGGGGTSENSPTMGMFLVTHV